MVLILRHRATPFAYNNAIWAKHGVPITTRTEYNDPATNRPPAVNLFADRLNGSIERRVHFAVCGVSTRNYARAIAAAGGGSEDEVFQLLTASLLENARIVPAGIITVNRAQERGYSLAYTG